jgi:HTH-type transcriptional regulator/antitoxin HigA
MNRPASPWSPDWAVAPGEFLGETLAERGMTQTELARRIARPLKTVSEIATGKAAITPDTAIQLERALGIPASFWNGAEARYREAQARERARVELREHASWLRLFPVKHLVLRDVLPAAATTEDAVAGLLAFFEVGSPAGWENQWGRVAASFRLPNNVKTSRYALAAWLRWGERQADLLDVATYDEGKFRGVLKRARRLSRAQVLTLALEQLTVELSQAGVALVVLESLPGAPASGAARWLRGTRPLIQLSLRYRSDDQFWYSLYHEGAHILSKTKRTDVVEDTEHPDLTDESEQAADAFARDALISPGALDAFVAKGDLTRVAVRAFAQDLEISPGIVVGRLQHDGVITHPRLSDLKRRYGRSS